MTEELNQTNNDTQVVNKKKFSFKFDPKKAFGALKAVKTTKVKINFKVLFAIFGLIFLGFAIYFGKGLVIAGVVNGRPIFRFSVISELERRSGQQVLEGLVNQSLIEQEARKRNITATQKEIEDDMKQIDDNMKAQGSSLADALVQQNMTKESFVKILRTNKLLEKMIADKVNVSDEEVKQYMETNKATLPTGVDEETLKTQVKTFLQQQKVDSESQKLFTELRANAKVNYWARF